MQILDCLKGFEKAMKAGWFNMKEFEIENYMKYERVSNGDINEIVKNRIFAFSAPINNNEIIDIGVNIF